MNLENQLTDAETNAIEFLDSVILLHPDSPAFMEQKKFCDWLKNKTFPFTFSYTTVGYFREDVTSFNHLVSELICADIDYDLDYDKDYLHITLESKEQIKEYEKIHFEWWKSNDKRSATYIEFPDMFVGSGLMSKMIEEGE